jgi:hypothetical protein
VAMIFRKIEPVKRVCPKMEADALSIFIGLNG